MTSDRYRLPFFLAVCLLVSNQCNVLAFVISPVSKLQNLHVSTCRNVDWRDLVVLRESEESTDKTLDEESSKVSEATKLSLEEKMKNWEATDEEIRAATLGGVVPERSDSFDVGLYIAFPFMVIGCLLFLAFPFIADKIDVSSVGPPPTN